MRGKRRVCVACACVRATLHPPTKSGPGCTQGGGGSSALTRLSRTSVSSIGAHGTRTGTTASGSAMHPCRTYVPCDSASRGSATRTAASSAQLLHGRVDFVPASVLIIMSPRVGIDRRPELRRDWGTTAVLVTVYGPPTLQSPRSAPHYPQPACHRSQAPAVAGPSGRWREGQSSFQLPAGGCVKQGSRGGGLPAPC